MEWVQSLNNAVDYIEKHLLEDICCENVAEYVHISTFHFQRTFNLLSGMTIQTYIRNRRLSLAGEELLHSDRKVIDVALKYRYETAESFSKAFSRFHGKSPSKVKMEKCLKSFNRLSIKISLEGGVSMDYRIEKHDEMRLLVYSKMFTAATSENGIPKFWEEYFKNEIYILAPGYLGICAQKVSRADEFLYGIGCNSRDVQSVPDGFELLSIPSNTWVIFKSVGPMPDAIQKMWDRIYREWLPSTKYELIPEYCIENYLPGDNHSDNYISEIWLPVTERG